jgi:adenosylhomocysteine nucleosidase
MSPSAATLPLLAVTGLRAEAKIAEGRGVATLSGGGDAARLALLLQGSLANGARAVVSFGIAGGLASGLAAGTVVIADAVDDGETRWETDPHWQARLADALPGAMRGTLAGSDRAVATVADKARLHRSAGGALAVDMESHVAARLAALHQVPFAALRVIADPAERALPEAAVVGMRPDGSTDVVAVIRALARRPGELPALLRTAFDARTAFAGLAAARNHLCAVFGFRDQPLDFGAEQVPAGQPETLLGLIESADTV